MFPNNHWTLVDKYEALEPWDIRQVFLAHVSNLLSEPRILVSGSIISSEIWTS